jgi:hypothetical protein
VAAVTAVAAGRRAHQNEGLLASSDLQDSITTAIATCPSPPHHPAQPLQAVRTLGQLQLNLGTTRPPSSSMAACTCRSTSASSGGGSCSKKGRGMQLWVTRKASRKP